VLFSRLSTIFQLHHLVSRPCSAADISFAFSKPCARIFAACNRRFAPPAICPGLVTTGLSSLDFGAVQHLCYLITVLAFSSYRAWVERFACFNARLLIAAVEIVI